MLVAVRETASAGTGTNPGTGTGGILIEEAVYE